MTEPDRHKWPLIGLRGVEPSLWRAFGKLVGEKRRSPVIRDFLLWFTGETDTPPVRPVDAAKGKAARGPRKPAATKVAERAAKKANVVTPGRAYPGK